jgi:hypothetical protein
MCSRNSIDAFPPSANNKPWLAPGLVISFIPEECFSKGLDKLFKRDWTFFSKVWTLI